MPVHQHQVEGFAVQIAQQRAGLAVALVGVAGALQGGLDQLSQDDVVYKNRDALSWGRNRPRGGT